MSRQSEAYLEQIIREDGINHSDFIRYDQCFELCYICQTAVKNLELKSSLNFWNCEIIETNISDIETRNLEIYGCSLHKSEIFNLRIVDGEEEVGKGRNKIAFSLFDSVLFEDCHFKNTHFYTSIFQSVTFKNCTFEECIFDESTKFIECSFINCKGQIGNGVKIMPGTVFVDVKFYENDRLMCSMTSPQYKDITPSELNP